MAFSGDKLIVGWAHRDRQVSTQLTILGQVVSSLFASIRSFPPDTGSWVESRCFARPLPGSFFIKFEFPGDVC